ncbi:MAG: sigma-70 family RNA polymerase sigma factor [Bryobacteraceae bacterium]|nr:sigma-70 family RNA polymerase sigma factor [Bryobacteraceae bacterium]
MTVTEEVELARDLLAGNEQAFDRFVDVFGSKLFRYSFLVCHQREDAEEITQEALLKVFQSLHQLREPERIRSWVFRVARNACLMKRRKSVFAPERELSLDDLRPSLSSEDGRRTLEIADWSNLPDEQLLQGELKQKVQAAIAGLPEIYRMVILLRDMEELSTSETAEVLDINEDLVKTRLHRARLAVRKELDQFLKGGQ